MVALDGRPRAKAGYGAMVLRWQIVVAKRRLVKNPRRLVKTPRRFVATKWHRGSAGSYCDERLRRLKTKKRPLLATIANKGLQSGE